MSFSLHESEASEHELYLEEANESPIQQVRSGVQELRFISNSLSIHEIKEFDAIVISKSSPGFDATTVGELLRFLSAVTKNKFKWLKYLVFDFAHQGEASGQGDGFEDLIAVLAELILEAPVITLAWARSDLSGADLDFALYCSQLVAQKGVRFSFEGEPAALFGLYAALARRIGLVQTERLIEQGQVLDGEEMRELNLAKELVEPREGLSGVEAYLSQQSRRYNSASAILQAQSIAMAPLDRAWRQRKTPEMIEG